MNSTPLISRRRHYFYVLVFSLAFWLFFAMLAGGFFPVYYETGTCVCGDHQVYMNISFLVFGAGGLLWGFIFSFVRNRWLRVQYSAPDSKEIPLSKIPNYGKLLLGWRGIVFLILVFGVYIGAEKITHAFILTHRTELSRIVRGNDLYCATARGDARFIRSKIRDGSLKPNKHWTYFGKSLLYTAAKHGRKNVIEVLLENGADIESRDGEKGYSALHVTSENDFMYIALFLIKRGANVNSLSVEGWEMTTDGGCHVVTHTPYDLAVSDEMRKLLHTHGGKTAAEILELQGR
ncbi:MAG: ankyrin repeat domain-containing protein [Planctomycetota bacterium]|jgi:hypothetical protein